MLQGIQRRTGFFRLWRFLRNEANFRGGGDGGLKACEALGNAGADGIGLGHELRGKFFLERKLRMWSVEGGQALLFALLLELLFFCFALGGTADGS